MARQTSGKRRALLQEAGDVEQLSSELTRQAVCDGAVDWQSQRRYPMRCAALADHAGSL
ncbi:hypothetical protein [Streptomyces spongiae]|uniref:hypothetical protein n=1 Tax=Streptomyces spongiae TaxID=565072 RepID=UPI001884027C|nr:hypothetical protein [Streptomyces spongiae]